MISLGRPKVIHAEEGIRRLNVEATKIQAIPASSPTKEKEEVKEPGPN